MASYRPFPPPPPPSQPTFPPPPCQDPLPPPPPPPPQSQQVNQHSQNWGYSGIDGSSHSSFQHASYGAQIPHHQLHSYPPSPPPDSSYPPPPPPPSMSQNQPAPVPMYFASSQYSQFNHQPQQPPLPLPPPPPSSPPPSSIPPPPPPSPSPPPPPPSSAPGDSQSEENRPEPRKGASNDIPSGWRESNHHTQGAPPKHYKSSVPPMPARKSNGPSGRIETEEERRLRKKREFEKQRQEEKHRLQLKVSQNKVLQKTQMLSSGVKVHGSISGSHMGDSRAAPFLSGERIDSRLKKPTTFLCKLKFRNELPDPAAQPKLLSLRRDKDRYANYSITSLEKLHKPQLYVEPDLGIPLDLLDLSAYNPPKGERILDPEDEELLRAVEPVTPIKKDGLKRKERPTDKGVSWLVKTQYISPLSTEATKLSLRDTRGGRNILENFNNRERKIKAIEASFEACKSRPVHATNKKLEPVEILPLLPDFDRHDDQFVIATFDNAPTADSDIYGKLDKSVRDAHESHAIMKSFVATSSDPANPDKFLAYMVPARHELSKDIYGDQEDISYTWIREYHWDVRGDDADDPTTYLVAFGESKARYAPLPTKLILRKKRAKDGKTSDEVEHFPVPSKVTVRRTSTVSVAESQKPGSHSSRKGKGRISNSRNRSGLQHKVVQDTYMDQSSGTEYDLSD